jgi:hypothetical protein
VRFVPCAVVHREVIMLTIGIIVLVLWLLGFLFFKAAKGFIHLLLLVAIVILLFHFLGGG